jgi:hypothetical protein
MPHHDDDGMNLATLLAIFQSEGPSRGPGRGCAWLLLIGSIIVLLLWWLSR